MARLRLVSPFTVSLQLFNNSDPIVGSESKSSVLVMSPNEVINEDEWLVSDLTSPSYNAELIDRYVAAHILTRIP